MDKTKAMETDDEKIRYAVLATEILRPPKQSLYTFGTTNVTYYLLTHPAYADLDLANTAGTLVWSLLSTSR